MSDYFVNRLLMPDDVKKAHVYASINGDENIRIAVVDKSRLHLEDITNWCFFLVLDNFNDSGRFYSPYCLPELPKDRPACLKVWHYTIQIGSVMKSIVERDIKDYERRFLSTDIKAVDVK